MNDLLYSGTYLFVGAPKVGKSFFMGQLAYHVAMGLPLWEYEVHQGTVLYLALEDDYARLQRRLSRMFGVEETSNLYFATQALSLIHISEGKKMLRNFVYNVCGCSGDWKMDSFVENNIKALRERIGEGKVLCALSGGVDSSVLAAMLAKAIGKQLTCVFVDHGLLRKNEKEEVCSVFGPGNANGFDINFICVDARDRYFSKLKGVTEPERKRKIIGEEFIRVFEEEAKKIGKVDFLAQGTIYPDVVESGLGGESTVIKSHHNVGGLPDTVDFKELVEPLRNLFKDERCV